MWCAVYVTCRTGDGSKIKILMMCNNQCNYYYLLLLLLLLLLFNGPRCMLGPALLPVPLRSRLLPGTTVTNRATSCVTRRPPQPWLSARQPAAAGIMFYKSDFFPIFKLFLLFFSFLEFIIMLYSISIN